MTWGNSSASSKVRLNYRSLKTAIDAKGNRGYKDMVQCHSNCWARIDRQTEEIHLKLHRTDIITYYPNDERVLRANNWHTPLTQHWFGLANVNIRAIKPNDWTGKEWFFIEPWGPAHLFYDGMRISNQGRLMSEPKPITKYELNDEAKDLRKRITQVVKVNYLPHLHLLEHTKWAETVVSWEVGLPGDGIKPLIDSEADPLPTIASALRRNRYNKGSATEVFKKYVKAQYQQYVKKMQMFDVVPYQPKEN